MKACRDRSFYNEKLLLCGKFISPLPGSVQSAPQHRSFRHGNVSSVLNPFVKMLHNLPMGIETMQTIYEAAGGLDGLVRLAHAWHTRVLEDEVVSHAFSHGYHPQHTERLAAYWAEALGGPAA